MMHNIDNGHDMLNPADQINNIDNQMEVPDLDIPWEVNDIVRAERDAQFLLSINSTVIERIEDVAEKLPSISIGPNSCFEAAIRAMSAHRISPYYLPSQDPTIRIAHVTRLCDDMTSTRGHFWHYMSLHWAVFVGQHGAPLMVTRSDGSRLEPFRGDTVTKSHMMGVVWPETRNG